MGQADGWEATLTVQLCSLVGVFIACLIGGLFPIGLGRFFRRATTTIRGGGGERAGIGTGGTRAGSEARHGRFLSLANCLGGGVLLGASFVHLMSDGEDGAIISDTASHTIVAIGFLFSFVLEKVLFEHHHHHDHGGGGVDGHAQGHDRIIFIEDFDHSGSPLLPSTKGLMYQELDVISDRPKQGNCTQGHESDHLSDASPDDPQGATEQHSAGGAGEAGTASSSSVLREKEDGEEGEGREEHDHEDRLGHRLGDNDHHHDHIVHHRHPPQKVPYVLLLVLSLESAVSGSALGVQNDYLKALSTFLAIVTHIWAEAFTLCTSFLKAKVADGKCAKVMLGFSLVTPASILGGMALAKVLSEHVISVISSVLIALAAGTFVYIATLEIIAEEFGNPHGKWAKLGLLTCGFVFMAVLGLVM